MTIANININELQSAEDICVVVQAQAYTETLHLMGKTVDEFWDKICELGVDNLTGIYDKLYSTLIKLLSRKFSYEQIGTLLFISPKKVGQLAEMIENAELRQNESQELNKQLSKAIASRNIPHVTLDRDANGNLFVDKENNPHLYDWAVNG